VAVRTVVQFMFYVGVIGILDKCGIVEKDKRLVSAYFKRVRFNILFKREGRVEIKKCFKWVWS
jgi:hypothetical protein